VGPLKSARCSHSTSTAIVGSPFIPLGGEGDWLLQNVLAIVYRTLDGVSAAILAASSSRALLRASLSVFLHPQA
jgi:hypothetical protein